MYLSTWAQRGSCSNMEEVNVFDRDIFEICHTKLEKVYGVGRPLSEGKNTYIVSGTLSSVCSMILVALSDPEPGGPSQSLESGKAASVRLDMHIAMAIDTTWGSQEVYRIYFKVIQRSCMMR